MATSEAAVELACRVPRHGQNQGFQAQTIRILLVADPGDGYTSCCAVVNKLLTESSYDVTIAKDSVTARSFIRERHFDLFLLDHEPGSHVNAQELLRFITADGKLRYTPAVVVSFVDDQETIASCLHLGAVDYLVKPVRRNELNNLWVHVWRRTGLRLSSGAPSAPTQSASPVLKEAESDSAQESCTVEQAEDYLGKKRSERFPPNAYVSGPPAAPFSQGENQARFERKPTDLKWGASVSTSAFRVYGSPSPAKRIKVVSEEQPNVERASSLPSSTASASKHAPYASQNPQKTATMSPANLHNANIHPANRTPIIPATPLAHPTSRSQTVANVHPANLSHPIPPNHRPGMMSCLGPPTTSQRKPSKPAVPAVPQPHPYTQPHMPSSQTVMPPASVSPAANPAHPYSYPYPQDLPGMSSLQPQHSPSYPLGVHQASLPVHAHPVYPLPPPAHLAPSRSAHHPSSLEHTPISSSGSAVEASYRMLPSGQYPPAYGGYDCHSPSLMHNTMAMQPQRPQAVLGGVDPYQPPTAAPHHPYPPTANAGCSAQPFAVDSWDGNLPKEPGIDVEGLQLRRQEALRKFQVKKQHRSFEKKILYDSRKQLAEQRPRVQGKFTRCESKKDEGACNVVRNETASTITAIREAL